MSDWEAVFWDVGGVLLNIPSVFVAQEAFVGRLAGIGGLDPDEAIETYRDELRDHFGGRVGREYRTAREGRRKAVAALLGDRVDEVDWRAIYEEEQEEHLEPNPGAVETVERLDEAGIYLGVISDADAGRPEYILDRFGIADRFDGITTSEEVGYTKPDPRMFEAALSKAGVDPGRSIMIGDKYENDVEGAADAGLHTVGYGAEEGPRTDHQIEDLREILRIVGIEG